MFKQPRRTICSDSRFTLQALNDRIYERLSEEDRCEYLLHVAEFFANMDETAEKKGQTFRQFANIVQPYLTDAEKHHITVDLVLPDANSETCSECGSHSFTYDGGYRACEGCGATIAHQCTGRAALSYNDVREEIHVYPYRRANHFQEWLIQCQAKQTTVIPDEVYEQLWGEIRKRRIDASTLTAATLKSVMKPLRLNKYYEHMAFILHKLSGQPPLRLSLEVEERMKQMFNDIQEPFDKVVAIVAPHRKNFLSYSFVLRKFAELMELDDIVEHFQLLKSREKLHVQDAIWRAICSELSWRFIPSL